MLRTLLYVAALPIFSRLYGRLVRLKHPRFLIQAIIRLFKDHYHIDMTEFQGEAEDYACLADFFVRPFDPEHRPLYPAEDAVVSPADGILKGIETIVEDKAGQVKGIHYKVSDLIREAVDFSCGWCLATIYLSPANYHRFHYPVSAALEAFCHARGSLYPVNSLGMSQVKQLFIKNERIITRFNLKGQPLYMVAVGATFVGSIKMLFIDKIKRDNRWKTLNQQVHQLDEMGRFDMGSTILLLLPQTLGTPLPAFKKGASDQPIRVGNPIFSLF